MSRQRASAGERSRLLFSAPEPEEDEVVEPPPAPAARPAARRRPAPAPVTEPVAERGAGRVATLQPGQLKTRDIRKTTQKFHRAHLNYLDSFVDALWVEEESRLSRDFIVRAFLRAVMELGLTLDFEGITLDEEDELVERVKGALAEHFAA